MYKQNRLVCFQYHSHLYQREGGSKIEELSCNGYEKEKVQIILECEQKGRK